MAPYVSEATQFLRELKQKRPELDRQQREARQIWWDKELDLDELRRQGESRVPQRGYVYQTSGIGDA